MPLRIESLTSYEMTQMTRLALNFHIHLRTSRNNDITRKRNHSSLLTPTVAGERRPFRLKFALKVTHPLRKTPTSIDFRSRGLSALADLLVL